MFHTHIHARTRLLVHTHTDRFRLLRAGAAISMRITPTHPSTLTHSAFHLAILSQVGAEVTSQASPPPLKNKKVI